MGKCEAEGGVDAIKTIFFAGKWGGPNMVEDGTPTTATGSCQCFGFPDLVVKKRRVGSPSVLVQANTSCSQESTHSHECAPFLSDQFAICACMCCVFSPPACAHHAVSYASLFPLLSRVFTSSLPSHPRCSSHRPLSLDLSYSFCWKRSWL